MTDSKKQYPPYVKDFVLPEDKGHIALYVHRTISGVIAQNYIRTQLPDEDFLTLGAGFWVLEGFVFEIELSEETYPSLNYYLEERKGLELPRRFELYKSLDENEIWVLIQAFNETRRHILETMIDTPLEEKKIES